MTGVVQLDAEPNAEQQREQCVELAVDKKILECTHYSVKRRVYGRIRKSPEGKLRKIRQDNAKECKTAQGIQDYVSFLRVQILDIDSVGRVQSYAILGI